MLWLLLCGARKPGIEIAEAQTERSTVATAQYSEPTALEELQPSDPFLKDARSQHDAGIRSATQAAAHEFMDSKVTERPIATTKGEPFELAEKQDTHISANTITKWSDSREDPMIGKMW